MWKRRFVTAAWCLLGAGAIVLLAAAMQRKDRRVCTNVKIEINGIDNHVFVDENELLAEMNKNGILAGKQLAQIPLRTLEARLEQNIWIKDAQLYFDNNNELHAEIREREPLARIFSTDGNSFYIDSNAMRLPLSTSYSASVPMFTSFPSSRKVLSAPDSAVLQDVKKIALIIASDSFWMAQVAQIDITPERKYEMIPVIGNQVIKLGSADEVQGKFKRLFSFYKNVWTKTGFEKYSVINAEYANQIVAVRREDIQPVTDSLKARNIFLNNIGKSGDVLKDSLAGMETPVALVTKKINYGSLNKPVVKEEKKPVEMKTSIDDRMKIGAKSKSGNQPKAVMPKLH
ncbi:MAG: hypothetical protein JWN76_1983 [Chitinophagaceae bacterium]|nr:hypothetical protein [Chitinophagaceae bacterium]